METTPTCTSADLIEDHERMNWLCTNTNYVILEEALYPNEGVREFIDWCMAGNDPHKFMHEEEVS